MNDELKTILQEYQEALKIFDDEAEDIGVNDYNVQRYIIDEKYLNKVATSLNNHAENVITILKTLKRDD